MARWSQGQGARSVVRAGRWGAAAPTTAHRSTAGRRPHPSTGLDGGRPKRHRETPAELDAWAHAELEGNAGHCLEAISAPGLAPAGSKREWQQHPGAADRARRSCTTSKRCCRRCTQTAPKRSRCAPVHRPRRSGGNESRRRVTSITSCDTNTRRADTDKGAAVWNGVTRASTTTCATGSPTGRQWRSSMPAATGSVSNI